MKLGSSFSSMRLNFKSLDLRFVNPWSIARSQGVNSFKVVTLELTDHECVRGLGEAAPINRYGETTETVEAFLLQLDVNYLSFDDLHGSLDYLHSVSPGNHAAKCAIDVALHDGAGKRSNQPVYDFVGLGFKEAHYVTSFSIGIDVPDVIRKKVQAADSYPILKMKVGVSQDRANLKALREVAPTKLVRVDANEGWKTKEQALEMIESLANDSHMQFVEQPLPASAPVADWVWLKQRSPLPIFGDESYHVAADAARAAECFHGVNVKLAKAGGISAALVALQAARKLGLKTMIGCMIETSVLISAGAHLAALSDYIDLDGNLLITNDPCVGVSATNGVLSFADAKEKAGLRVSPR